MARFARPKQRSSSIRVIRAVLLTVSIVVLASILFSMDSFHRKHEGGLYRGRAALASPEQAIIQQQQEAQALALRQQQEQNAADSQPDEEEEEEPAEADAADETDTQQGKRFIMTLGGLNGQQEDQVVRFETRPDWAPNGVERFHQLVEAQFYNQCRFFRVLPKFVVQFGIAADPAVHEQWKEAIPDDPVKQTNERGTITFAMSGKNTRTTQLFINLVNNKRLDTQGFAPIGVVLEGMEYVDQINDQYREKPGQGKIVRRGNAYLNEEFPELSYVVSIQPEQDGPQGGPDVVAAE